MQDEGALFPRLENIPDHPNPLTDRARKFNRLPAAGVTAWLVVRIKQTPNLGRIVAPLVGLVSIVEIEEDHTFSSPGTS